MFGKTIPAALTVMTTTALANDPNWPAKVTAQDIVFERDAAEYSATVTKDTPLVPSGLIGPVYLRDVNTTEIK